MLPERIAVDATALISASIKGRALRLFLTPIHEFLTTSLNFEEACHSLPDVCQKLERIPLLEAELICHTLPIQIFERNQYRSKFEEANQLIGHIDKKDRDLLALALEKNIPIWSEDSHFKRKEIRHNVKCYTTAELFKLWERM